MKHGFWTSLAHTFRRTALPLAAYYAVTLALPMANGAARSGAFVRHALVVLVVPPIGVFFTVVLNTVVRSLAADLRLRAAPGNGSATQGPETRIGAEQAGPY